MWLLELFVSLSKRPFPVLKQRPSQPYNPSPREPRRSCSWVLRSRPPDPPFDLPNSFLALRKLESILNSLYCLPGHVSVSVVGIAVQTQYRCRCFSWCNVGDSFCDLSLCSKSHEFLLLLIVYRSIDASLQWLSSLFWSSLLSLGFRPIPDSCSVDAESHVSRFFIKPLTVSVKLKSPKSHSLLCRPQSEYVPLLLRFSIFGLEDGDESDAFESVDARFSSLVVMNLTPPVGLFGELYDDRGVILCEVPLGLISGDMGLEVA